MQAPRAWPSSRVDWGLTLTNTISTEDTSGSYRAATSVMPSNKIFSRPGRSPSASVVVRMVPLAT